MGLPRIKLNIPVQSQLEKSLAYFNSYVDRLPIDSQNKVRIKDNSFIEKNFSLYLYYPYLFSSAFNIDDDKVVNLAVAGYLYYKSIIYMDEMMDKGKMSVESIGMITICQEESIKLLSSIFPPGSSFWKFWSLRRSEYVKAYVIDKLTHNIDSFKEFTEHAGRKSAFGKAARHLTRLG